MVRVSDLLSQSISFLTETKSMSLVNSQMHGQHCLWDESVREVLGPKDQKQVESDSCQQIQPRFWSPGNRPFTQLTTHVLTIDLFSFIFQIIEQNMVKQVSSIAIPLNKRHIVSILILSFSSASVTESRVHARLRHAGKPCLRSI